MLIFKSQINAAVVESADTKDLKSFGGNIVPVQVRSAAPNKDVTFDTISEDRKPLVSRGFLLS
jgi:hypothetical protein